MFSINQNTLHRSFLTRKFRIAKKCGRDRRCHGLRRRNALLFTRCHS